MYGTDLGSADILRVLESVSENALGCLSRDELDALDNTINDNMLDTGVLSLGVLTDEDCVDIVVRCLETFDRLAGTDVREEVECAAKSEVQGDVTFANGCLFCWSAQKTSFIYERTYSKRSLERNVVLPHTVDSILWDSGLAVYEPWCNIDWLPFDWDLEACSVGDRRIHVLQNSRLQLCRYP